MDDQVSLIKPVPGDYHRPNEKWVCSSQELCDGCTGPSATGSCPLNQCQPRLSLREQRKRFTVAVTCLTIGAIIILFSSTWRNEFIAPGNLCTAHARLMQTGDAMQCSACHQQAEAGLGKWIGDIFGGNSSVGPTQSHLCLKCHNEEFDNKNALAVHNVSADTIAELTSQFQRSQFDVRNVVAAPNAHGGDISCATCHKEHQGAGNNLKLLTDNQCQSCHAQHYHSFERDHPEFSDWPTVKTSSIQFDHVSHMQKHFPSKGKTVSCLDCHQSDDAGIVQRLKPFAQACGDCHDQQIKASLGQRHQLLALPMLDLQTLRKADISIGQWPETADGDFDGIISPLAQILLMADDDAKSAFDQLPTGFTFADVDPGNTTQLQAVGRLAWAMKQLLYDLAEDSEDTLHKRLNKVVGDNIDSATVKQISAQLHSALFREAQRYWMPRLAMEIQLRNAGQDAQTIAIPLGPETFVANAKTTQDEILAPNPLSDIPQYQSSQSNAAQVQGNSPSALPTVAQSSENASATRRFSNPMLEPVNRVQQFQPPQQTQSNDDQLLAENPLKNWLQNPDSPVVIQPDPANAAMGQNTRPQNSTDNAAAMQSGMDPEHAEIVAAAMRQLANAGHSRWIRNDLTMSIDYVPEGHADPVIKAWYEIAVIAGRKTTLGDLDLVKAIDNPLSKLGTCSSCHNVNRTNPDAFVHWQATYRNMNIRSWTNFSHAPHLIQPDSKNCQTCHKLRQGSGPSIQMVSTSSPTPCPDFMPMTKQDCTSCHRANAASNSCTTCHSYHIGSTIRGRIK
jgi:hypothetical protein